ncbi:MAG: hypothetical protein ABIP64_07020 [Burkholderiales bacterium]
MTHKLASCLFLLFATANAATAGECQPEGAYDQFAFRPPQGFVELRARTVQNGITYTFREDKLETEAAGVIQFVFSYTKEDYSLLKPDQQEEVKELLLKRYLGGIENRRADFVKSEIQTQAVGNSNFKKIEWTGKAGSEVMKGIMYVTVINNVVTVVNVQAPTPGEEPILKTIYGCLNTLKLTLD